MSSLIELWKKLGTAPGAGARLARLITYALLLFLAWNSVTTIFEWPEQGILGILTIALAVAVHKTSQKEMVTLALMFASMLATARYAFWRCSSVFNAAVDPGSRVNKIDLAFMVILLSAEVYAFAILFLGYVQTIRPLRRPPAPLPTDVDDWPDVDILIPSYNEPLLVVRSTAFAARNIDYPPDKIHVYVLDDGRREDFRQFCEEADIGYVTRTDNKHAKAGNINSALKKLGSPYVAIFDCDHVPTRSFLQVTLGWFHRDERLGMLQTPHFFYSPDPFERNLKQFKAVPNEGELFYGIIQDCSDLWNATFFCGSCAVLRRTALEEIGGIATETVTEDAHTSLRMQTRGWNTAYINIPQAAGLATESLSGHVGQRIRWARGMIQILRTDNPLFARGLKWPQRLCYFNAMAHFLYAVPRLLFLTAPLVYLLLGRTNIPGNWIAIMAYALPHLFLSNITNFRIQGKHRHSFWNEVYETVLAPYILGPTLLALVNPKLGKFNVTAKGGVVDKSYFDARIARPYVGLILINVLALIIAPIRYFYWNADHPGTVVMNVIWVLFNMVIIGSANAVAFESRQLRTDVRIDKHIPAEVRIPGGDILFGKSSDMSLGGAALKLEQPSTLSAGTAVEVVYPLREQQVAFPATVVSTQNSELRLKYGHFSVEQEELMTLILYSRADAWLAPDAKREEDKPLRSFGRLMALSVKGVGYALGTLIPRKKAAVVVAPAGAAVAMLALFFAGASGVLHAESAVMAPRATAAVAKAGEGSFHSTFTLKDIGVPDAIIFRGIDASRSVDFALPQAQIAQQAKLNLRYSFSPSLITQLSHLNVLLNGSLIASLPVPTKTGDAVDGLSTTLTLPAELLARNNQLGFQFISHYTMQCEDPSNTALWGRVEANSSIEVAGSLLPLSNNLNMLPLPFYDEEIGSSSASIPFAFVSQPSNRALEAAGVVASWFGVRAKSRALTFPVTFDGALPKGNVVLFVEGSGGMPADFDLRGRGPVIAVRTNPSDPYGKVLIIAGEDGSQLVTAARSLALENNLLQGQTVQVSDFQLPPVRQADDAPLWLRTDRVSPFWNYSVANTLQSDGSGTLPVYVRIPPDLDFSNETTLPLHLDYRYNAVPLAGGSTMRVSANGSLVNELALPQRDNPKQTLDATVAVPLVSMRPFANTFLFNFFFQIGKGAPCRTTPPINLQGGLLRSSYLDLRGLHHWTAMPNLELFANAGFPFTRFADLSQTRIVLPPKATSAEIGLYLTLVAYFAEQTGYPALRLQVDDSTGLGKDADYLVLGTPSDQPVFDELNQHLPVTVAQDGVSVKDTKGFFSAIQAAWWQIAEMRQDRWGKLTNNRQNPGSIADLGEFPDAVIQGIESPWHPGRSVVSVTIKNDNSITAFTDAFLKTASSASISDSVSILQGTGFTSYRLGDSFYQVGHLPWWSRVRHWLKEFPWLIVLLTFLLGWFVVPWTIARLDLRARARLEGRPV
jgi:cellulose synthase catalytic subunit (UDP-forming)